LSSSYANLYNSAPESAWLLKGDEKSFPSSGELRDLVIDAHRNDFQVWTAAPQTKQGDLLFIYFMAPRKAIHFVARAASDAYFDSKAEINAAKSVNRAQWLVELTPLLPIVPIALSEYRAAVGDQVVLKGRSGLFISPSTFDNLTISSASNAQELERCVTRPVGLAQLPDPSQITMSQWRDIAGGALRLEADVTTYVVEPLLRHLVASRAITWSREQRVGNGFADVLVHDGPDPIHVIEVKKVIRTPQAGNWNQSPDVKQARRYADKLGVGATVIDSHRVMLLSPDPRNPPRIIERRSASVAELSDIQQHMLGTA